MHWSLTLTLNSKCAKMLQMLSLTSQTGDLKDWIAIARNTVPPSAADNLPHQSQVQLDNERGGPMTHDPSLSYSQTELTKFIISIVLAYGSETEAKQPHTTEQGADMCSKPHKPAKDWGLTGIKRLQNTHPRYHPSQCEKQWKTSLSNCKHHRMLHSRLQQHPPPHLSQGFQTEAVQRQPDIPRAGYAYWSCCFQQNSSLNRIHQRRTVKDKLLTPHPTELKQAQVGTPSKAEQHSNLQTSCDFLFVLQRGLSLVSDASLCALSILVWLSILLEWPQFVVKVHCKISYWLRWPNMERFPVRKSVIGEEILHKDAFIEQFFCCHLHQSYLW